ncbi:MAG: DUF4435 domain-containing protein [Bacteroidales bacterium]|nr:DUF4435 domain-containing protein [Bacteroidales bacterium]
MTDISPINVPADIRQVDSVFLQYRNDINIYTEDKEEDKEFYVKLFDKLLDGTDIRVRDIYPLGNKSTVIKKCTEDHSPHPKIYIVDGDIFLQFKKYAPVDNLFRLDSYCIENYVVDKNSVEKLAYDLTGTKPLKTIKSEVNYDARTKRIAEPLVMLFFMISIQAELTEKFEIKNIEAFMDKSTCELDCAKIEKTISEITSAIKKTGVSETEINSKMSQRLSDFGISEKTLQTIVSGKDWIIPYWRKVITKISGGKLRLKKETWKFKLVDFCSLARLDNLKNEIIRTTKKFNYGKEKHS